MTVFEPAPQAGQTPVPLGADGSHPPDRVLERLRGEGIPHLATGPRRRYEAGLVQRVQVLHDRLPADGLGGGQLGRGGRLLFCQPAEQTPACRVGERREHGVDAIAPHAHATAMARAPAPARGDSTSRWREPASAGSHVIVTGGACPTSSPVTGHPVNPTPRPRPTSPP